MRRVLIVLAIVGFAAAALLLVPTRRPAFVGERGAVQRPLPGVEVTMLFSGADGGERLALLRASSSTWVWLDASQSVLAVLVAGEVSLNEDPRVPLSPADRPRVVLGEGARCGSRLLVAPGTELLLLQASAGPGELVGPDRKEKCQLDGAHLHRAESPQNEAFTLGTEGSVRFLSQNALAYAGDLRVNPGAVVEPNQHDRSTELLYVLDRGGTVTSGGVTATIGPGDAIRMAAGQTYAFTAGPNGCRAIQFYLPPGPEEHFRPKSATPPGDAGADPTLGSPRDAVEDDVYSAVLASSFRYARSIAVNDRTSAQGIASVELEYAATKMGLLTSATATDFLRANGQARTVGQDRLRAAVPVRVVADSEYGRLSGRGTKGGGDPGVGCATFSRVGFDPSGRQALVHVFSSGGAWFVLLEKVDGAWQVKGKATTIVR